ncbi:hypothetical protein J6590_101093 [Homalodisca vitripennis]|nr:hypothetical protein J6590_101093 [Homalodisca vitripennis]
MVGCLVQYLQVTRNGDGGNHPLVCNLKTNSSIQHNTSINNRVFQVFGSISTSNEEWRWRGTTALVCNSENKPQYKHNTSINNRVFQVFGSISTSNEEWRWRGTTRSSAILKTNSIQTQYEYQQPSVSSVWFNIYITRNGDGGEPPLVCNSENKLLNTNTIRVSTECFKCLVQYLQVTRNGDGGEPPARLQF